MSVETKVPLSEAMLEARTERGWAQEACARKLDVSLVQYRAWEKGKNEPRMSHFLAICDLFGLDPFALTIRYVQEESFLRGWVEPSERPRSKGRKQQAVKGQSALKVA